MVRISTATIVVVAVCSSTSWAACLYNSSHCQCAKGHTSGLCLHRDFYENQSMTCLVDTCKSSYKCDCMGSFVCSLESCVKYKLSAAQSSTASLGLSSKVQCVEENGICVGLPTGDVATPCIHNSTHCQCGSGQGGGHCLRFISGSASSATCIVEECSTRGYKCDCMGEFLCQLRSCGHWTSSVDTTSMVVGSTVPCSYLDSLSGMSGTCALLV